MSKNTPNTPAATAATPLAAATVQAIIDRGNAIAAAQSAGDTAVRTAEWHRFHETCDALADLGKFLAGKSVAGKLAAGTSLSGDSIRKAMADKASGIYVDTAARADLPSASTFSRALAIHADDTAARRAKFESVGNLPTVKDYLPWLTLECGRKLPGSATSIDAAKTVTGKGATRTVGKLVRKPAARKGGSAPKVTIDPAATAPEFGRIEMMSDDELAAIPAVADIGSIPADKRLALARQLIAAALIDQRAAKVSDLMILPSIS